MSLGENIPRLAEVLEGRSVLVTGGTGSFGRAFAEAVLEHGNPHRVILFSRDEQKHYRLQKELTDRRLRFFVGDIRDRSRLTMAFRDVENAAILQIVQNISTRTVKGAAVIVTITPILCVYPFLQKYFTKGILIGAIKA